MSLHLACLLSISDVLGLRLEMLLLLPDNAWQCLFYCFQIKADNVPEKDESFFVNLTSVTTLPSDNDQGV